MSLMTRLQDLAANDNLPYYMWQRSLWRTYMFKKWYGFD